MRFKDQDGKETEQNYNLSLRANIADLREIVKAITKEEEDNEYTFYYKTVEVRHSLPDPKESV